MEPFGGFGDLALRRAGTGGGDREGAGGGGGAPTGPSIGGAPTGSTNGGRGCAPTESGWKSSSSSSKFGFDELEWVG